MESFFSRYRNATVLVGTLFVQLIMLATQIKAPAPASGAPGGLGGRPAEGAPLIRTWATGILTPFERLAVYTGGGVRTLWHSYIDLVHTRSENNELLRKIDQLRLEQAKMREDAEQGQRLQKLLGFKEQFPSQTLAAQVIGTSGTDTSRVIYIDKGTSSHVENGMAVITPDGIVGKVLRADSSTSQVLLINDPSSGAGVILERTRLNGILQGTSSGKTQVVDVMSDENIAVGDKIVTSGGDRVYPKGLPVGTVAGVAPDEQDGSFLDIAVKPAADLAHLEEVLVVTKTAQSAAAQDANLDVSPTRTVDMLAQRLPSVPEKPADAGKTGGAGGKAAAPAAKSANQTVGTAVKSAATTQKPGVAAEKNAATGATVKPAQPKAVKPATAQPETAPPSETETPH